MNESGLPPKPALHGATQAPTAPGVPLNPVQPSVPSKPSAYRVEPVPLPAPDRRFNDADLPTLRTRALRPREIPMPVPRNGQQGNVSEETEIESPARAAIRGFTATNPEPRPPRPPTVSQTAPSVRREIPRPPAPESEIRITYEDPGGWGVL